MADRAVTPPLLIPEPVSSGATASPQTEPASNLADVFPLRAQASLFILLVAFLAVVGWRTWHPILPTDNTAALVGASVDLNRAERTELLSLPGMGPALADRIISYREQHGPFEGLADLQKVSGLGPALLERLRPHVALSWPAHVEPKRAPGPSVVTFAPASLSAKVIDRTSVVDPNHASLEQLQTLPGIGPVLAQRIIERRQQKAFVEVSDLRKVPGIGPKTLDKIKPRLQIGDGSSRVQ